MPSLSILLSISALVLTAITIGWGALTYNKLVASRNRTDVAWGQVEVQLQRRFDLVPSLVAAVKGYAAHEQGTFLTVTQARQQVQYAADPKAQVSAENFLTSALRQIFALSEDYPELKADRNFRKLQEDLVVVENKVAIARQIYNDTVYTYNTTQQQIPAAFIAVPLGFTERTLFDAPTAADRAPSVEF